MHRRVRNSWQRIQQSSGYLKKRKHHSMKTIFDKMPLELKAGQKFYLPLPEGFRTSDSLVLIVHNASVEKLEVTLTAGEGQDLSQVFSLDSFPAVVVFPEEKSAQHYETTYQTVSFTCFHDFQGSLTYRVKNPAHILTAYRS